MSAQGELQWLGQNGGIYDDHNRGLAVNSDIQTKVGYVAILGSFADDGSRFSIGSRTFKSIYGTFSYVGKVSVKNSRT